MDIKEFTLPKFLDLIRGNQDLEKKYYSQVYGEHFPLNRRLLSRNADLIAKLDPIRKEEAKYLISDFHRKVNTNQRFSNYRGDYLFGPDEHFLFRYKIPIQTENLHIRFRTKSDDRLVDDFLEFLQESAIIRVCCVSDSLDKRIEGPLREAYEESVVDNNYLIDDPQEQLIYMKRERRMYWIKGTLSLIFDVMHLMEKRGYSIHEVIDGISKVEIRPDKEDSSLIWNSAFDILRSKYL